MTVWNSPITGPRVVLSEAERTMLRQYASRYDGRAAAAMSHVVWVAEKIRTTVTELLTEAQMREELAIESLVRAKAACEDTEEPAVAVLEAAQAVSNLEAHIEELTKLIDEHGVTVSAPLRVDRLHVDTVKMSGTRDEDETGDCDA